MKMTKLRTWAFFYRRHLSHNNAQSGKQDSLFERCLSSITSFTRNKMNIARIMGINMLTHSLTEDLPTSSPLIDELSQWNTRFPPSASSHLLSPDQSGINISGFSFV